MWPKLAKPNFVDGWLELDTIFAVSNFLQCERMKREWMVCIKPIKNIALLWNNAALISKDYLYRVWRVESARFLFCPYINSYTFFDVCKMYLGKIHTGP